MLTVAFAFLITWVIPNQILVVLLIGIVDNNSAATLTLRSTMLLGAIEKQSCSIAKSLAAITAQLNSCINFFIYALRHNKFRQHLRLMCGGDKNSLQTAIAVPSVKASTLPSAPEGMRVIRY